MLLVKISSCDLS